MKQFIQAASLAATIAAFCASSALAGMMEGEMGGGMQPGGMQQGGAPKGGMQGGSMQGGAHGMASPEMHKKMDELRQHSEKMEGIKDQKQLLTEMRKHMEMSDKMMQEMMAQEGSAGGGAPAQPAAPQQQPGGMSDM